MSAKAQCPVGPTPLRDRGHGHQCSQCNRHRRRLRYRNPAARRAPNGSPGTTDTIEVQLLDRNWQIIGRTQPSQAPAVFQYGPLGGMYSFGVEVVTAMLGTADPSIGVHWWFDIGSAVRYRVHCYCTGDRCDIPWRGRSIARRKGSLDVQGLASVTSHRVGPATRCSPTTKPGQARIGGCGRR